MAISREKKTEFVKMREIDGVTLEDCAKELGIAWSTAQRWAKEPWYEEIAYTVRRSRDQAIEEAARDAAKDKAALMVDTQTEWDTKRRGYIDRVRSTAERIVSTLETLSKRIQEPDRYEDMREYKAAVDAYGKLTDVARKVLMVEHEEKMAVAGAQAAASQRMTPEEIAMLSLDQLRLLMQEGIESVRTQRQAINVETLPE